DFFFYPAPMFVSLVTHGLQAVVISLISHKVLQNNPKLASGLGVLAGAVIMVVGYSLGRAYVYSTPEYAIIKLPFQILQALVGVVFGMLLCWKFGVHKLFTEMLTSKEQ
ncbi:MAG: ECF transporter S component, partial [Firmicutes bacterium]|nr:ECF transporter S component [Bacillota bacterium]MBR6025764.1 ECF transporter S component [Bacillota bacterium]